MLVGKKAPVFKAPALVNGTEIVQNFSLEQYAGDKYVVFFFYPKDFTAVCPTELHAFQDALSEFESRGCAVVACSTDTEQSHKAWAKIEKENGGIKGVTFPIVADGAKTISTNYGVLNGEYSYNEEGELIATGSMIALRGLFIIDKNGKIRHQTVNELSLGRDVSDTLRTLDAVQHIDEFGESCPANWRSSSTSK